MEVHPAAEPWIEALAQASRELSAALAPIAGVIVEDKTWSLSVHYRLADPGIGPRLRAVVDEVAERLGLAVTSGKMLIEVRAPVEVNKGTAVIALAERLGALEPGASVIFAGDDVTDEDAFRRLRIEHPGAVTVRVTEHPEMPTAAEFAVRDPAAVQDGLERLLVLRRRRVAD